ncbi:YjeF family domain-containing protein [Plasmodium fragile]|uniref:ATP-dependent (S)-NAD(P)H-hydrate dehydratase n=1 Tax=Plasmodium fragile TaxID=5857 RepID=A0A0D9QFS4_PLAFR|nr:YjeF family domain-containing protein [Plasmodium fragile]KJP85859.1 YjeF family domain-containing protein [Plasmodium fragile]
MEEYSVSADPHLTRVHLNRKLPNETLYRLQQYVIPELSPKDYKGCGGKICVVGGSEVYSGASFLSAMSALKLGADLSFVITAQENGIPLKCYSPELIVYPYLYNQKSNISQVPGEELKKCTEYLSNRIDCCVFGPGLGSIDEVTKDCLSYIIKKMIEKNIFLILDADIIEFILTNTDILCLIQNYQHCLFTPNKNEFRKMIFLLTQEDGQNLKFHDLTTDKIIYQGHKLIRLLDGPKIMIKGFYDVFISRNFFFVSSVQDPCLKRLAGLGDVLTGLLAVFHTWAGKKKDKFSPTLKEEFHVDSIDGQNECLDALSAFCGSFFLKYLCREKFKKYHRGLLASDVIKGIPHYFHFLYDGGCESSSRDHQSLFPG